MINFYLIVLILNPEQNLETGPSLFAALKLWNALPLDLRSAKTQHMNKIFLCNNNNNNL